MKYLESRKFTIDQETMRSCIDEDEYLLEVLMKKNGVFLDVGAFVGGAGVKAFLCGASKVIYVEPNKDNCETIDKFYKFNNYDYDYTIIESCAHSDNDGVYVNENYDETLNFEDNRKNVMNVFSNKGNKKLLPSINLEGIFSSTGISSINVLKIDCEGSEYDFLNNNEIFKNVDVIVGEFHKLAYNGNIYDAKTLLELTKDNFVDITQEMKSKNLVNDHHLPFYSGLFTDEGIGLFVLLNKKFNNLDHYLSIDLY